VENIRITNICAKIDDLKVPVNYRAEAKRVALEYHRRQCAMMDRIATKILVGEPYNMETMINRFYWPAITGYQTV